jgi:hypothetical protein
MLRRRELRYSFFTSGDGDFASDGRQKLGDDFVHVRRDFMAAAFENEPMFDGFVGRQFAMEIEGVFITDDIVFVAVDLEEMAVGIEFGIWLNETGVMFKQRIDRIA